MDFNSHSFEQARNLFLKKLFHLLEHARDHSLHFISGLLTIRTLIDQRNLFFLVRIITFHSSAKNVSI